MPELYRLADHTHVNTQAEAKHSGQPWEKVEVPTKRHELLEYLNQMVLNVRGPSSPLQAAEPPEPETEPVIPTVPAPVVIPQPPPAITAHMVEEFILEHATTYQIENIFGCMGTRFHELRKKAREAVD